MERLPYDYQHVYENSERHKVEMLTPFVEKNNNMACQGINAFIITYNVYYWPSKRNISGFWS